MSIINHIDKVIYEKRTCSKCKKTFYYISEEQVPGFRSKEELKCPYCDEIIVTSMEEEFTTYKAEEIEGDSNE